MRTLIRAGRRAVLVKIESRKGTRFVVGGGEPTPEREVYLDLDEATRSFEKVERGLNLRRRPRSSLAERIRDTLPRELVAFLATHTADARSAAQ